MHQVDIFSNTEVAFALKSDSEIERAVFLFKLIANEPLVKIGTAVTNFAIKTHLPVEGLIRSTVFDHFCGGTTEADCLPIVEKMREKNVFSVLDFSVEGKESEAQFNRALDKTIEIIEFATSHNALHFAVFKPTGFARFDLLEKKSTGETLSAKEQKEWEAAEQRFWKVGEVAFQKNIGLLIDAEESWIQQAVDDLVLDMMRKFNKERPIIFNTLQCYRKDRFEYADFLLNTANKEGFNAGFKIVRGAYMEKENKRAEQSGYLSPICPDKKTTDENFNRIMQLILRNLNHHQLFIGSHNEESTVLAMNSMHSFDIGPNDPRIWFGQLFGMSDHITFNMAVRNYNVTKYVPFGPVRDVMPYLIRRAEENTSVAGQTNRELALLTAERKRRNI